MFNAKTITNWLIAFCWAVVEVFEAGPTDDFQRNSNAREGGGASRIVKDVKSPMQFNPLSWIE